MDSNRFKVENPDKYFNDNLHNPLTDLQNLDDEIKKIDPSNTQKIMVNINSSSAKMSEMSKSSDDIGRISSTA